MPAPVAPTAAPSAGAAVTAERRRLITPKDLKDKARDALGGYKTLLSLDGGGMRGLLTAKVLEQLERTIKEVIWQERVRILIDPAGLNSPDDFDIFIADWFDQLSGTSTGGLLALYLAVRSEKHAPFCGELLGSAAGAVKLYDARGQKIFGTSGWRKIWNALTTSAKYQHPAKGLEEVLFEVFGTKTMDDLKSNVVITTTDAGNARSGAFFHKTSETQAWKPDSAQPAGSGFTSARRRATGETMVLWRDVEAAKYKTPGDRKVSDLSLGRLQLRSLKDMTNDDHKRREEGAWLTPIQVEPWNFRITQVARATSAAPAFLPPIKVAPIMPTGVANPDKSWPRTFVDGGLGNNDPTWMGLTFLLQEQLILPRPAMPGGSKSSEAKVSHSQLGLAKCAILSLGTGQAVSFGAYDPPKRGFFAFLRRLNPLNILGFTGGLVGLAMSLNGEDKEKILQMLYYGLLRLPEGQYMRVQLEKELGDILTVGDKMGVLTTSDSPQQGGMADLKWSKAQIARALGNMDDPSPTTRAVYRDLGAALAEYYKQRMMWWVRCFVFGLDDPLTRAGGSSVPEGRESPPPSDSPPASTPAAPATPAPSTHGDAVAPAAVAP